MSLWTCAKCWDVLCRCGFEYKDLKEQHRIDIAAAALGVTSPCMTEVLAEFRSRPDQDWKSKYPIPVEENAPTTKPVLLYVIRWADHSPGMDEYDSAVVAACSEEEARNIHPCDSSAHREYVDSWTTPDNVTATLIGRATPGTVPGTVLCASFNAG